MVRIEGVIGSGGLASSDSVIPAVKRAFEASKINAVVLAIDSGGGSPVEAERIYRAVDAWKKETGKPVVAVIGNIGASAAYMIALHTDRIYAAQYSLIGSVGAVLQGWDFHRALDRLSVSQRVYASGNLKSMLNPFLPMSPEAEAKAKNLVQVMGMQFRDELDRLRAGKLKAGVNYSSSEVWGGLEAQRVGMVDEIGTLDDIVKAQWNAPIHDFGPRRACRSPPPRPTGCARSSWRRRRHRGRCDEPGPGGLDRDGGSAARAVALEPSAGSIEPGKGRRVRRHGPLAHYGNPLRPLAAMNASNSDSGKPANGAGGDDPAFRSARPPSKRMPPLPTRGKSLRTWLILALATALVLVASIAVWPAPLAVLVVLVVTVSVAQRSRSRRALARLAADRPGESICSFARRFDCRKVDTWVIRAVYETLQDDLKGDFRQFPLRPDDDLLRTLKIDAEDLEFDLLQTMAYRCRRRLPSAAEVHAVTVGDLVHYLNGLEAA